MKEERQRILKLVENGTISAQEAISLLEMLEKAPEAKAKIEDTQSVTEKKEPIQEQEKEDEYAFSDDDFSKKSTEDEFIDDLKKDFAKFSSRFADFIGSTVSKVKDIDFSTMSPMGKKVSWKQQLDNTGFANISVDMPNGQLTIRDSADGSAHLEIEATPMLQFGSSREVSEDEMKKEFNATIDAGTLRIHNLAKLTKTDVILYIPKGQYNKVRANLFNGGFSMHSLSVDQLRVETKNGNISLSDVIFDSAEVESANGSIDIRDFSGRDLEAETINGRVYIDGAIRSIEAKSVNGNIALTTKSQQSERIKAHTTAGTIEIYIPKELGIVGEISSALGKMDVELADVEFVHESSQVFNKSMRFRKEVADAQKLTIDGETKTGSVIIRYTL